MALVAIQQIATSSSIAVPHGPAGVGAARRRMRQDLRSGGAAEAAIDDASLVLSELLSNSCRHARPLDREQVHASWSQNALGEITISVTDGGGPTLPRVATPSVSARGGRGLTIIGALARDWGVREYSAGRSAPRSGRGRGSGADTDYGSDFGSDFGPDRAGPGAVTVWAILPAQDG